MAAAMRCSLPILLLVPGTLAFLSPMRPPERPLSPGGRAASMRSPTRLRFDLDALGLSGESGKNALIGVWLFGGLVPALIGINSYAVDKLSAPAKYDGFVDTDAAKVAAGAARLPLASAGAPDAVLADDVVAVLDAFAASYDAGAFLPLGAALGADAGDAAAGQQPLYLPRAAFRAAVARRTRGAPDAALDAVFNAWAGGSGARARRLLYPPFSTRSSLLSRRHASFSPAADLIPGRESTSGFQAFAPLPVGARAFHPRHRSRRSPRSTPRSRPGARATGPGTSAPWTGPSPAARRPSPSASSASSSSTSSPSSSSAARRRASSSTPARKVPICVAPRSEKRVVNAALRGRGRSGGARAASRHAAYPRWPATWMWRAWPCLRSSASSGATAL